MKFPLYPISKVLISNLTFVFQNVEPKYPILGVLGQKVLTFKSFNEIFPVPYFEGADYKSNICFPKCWAQIPYFGRFGPKSINF